MRRSLIDFLLSDECTYTSYERLMLFVLHAAIEGGKKNIDKKEIVKAAAIHRNTVPKILASLKAKKAIALGGAPDAPVYFVRDEHFVCAGREIKGKTVGEGIIIINTRGNINNNIYNKTNKVARAREADAVGNCADAQKVTDSNVGNCADAQKVTDTCVGNCADAQKTTNGDVQNASPESTVREDIAKLSRLQMQQTASPVAPERGIIATDSHGGRIYLDPDTDEAKFLSAYHKPPANESRFSEIFRRALIDAGGDVGKLIAAAEEYEKVLKSGRIVVYRKVPEVFLSCCMWKDYLPEAKPDTAPGYSGDEQAFLDAYGKAPRDTDRFRRMFARGMEEAGSVGTLIEAFRDYAEQLRHKDGSLMCLPRPENWLEDCGWRDYTRRYGGRVCGPAGGQIDPPAPTSSGFTRLEEGDDAY